MIQANSEHITPASGERLRPINASQAPDGEPPANPAQAVSRRGLLMSAAVVSVTSLAPAAGFSASAMPSRGVGAETDPIFAAIEAHRTAHAAFEQACQAVGCLETYKPEIKSAPETVRLIAREKAASDEDFDTAVALLNVVPTTIAGAVALLRFANERINAYGDFEWPDDVRGGVEEEEEEDVDEEEEEDAPSMPWVFFLHQHVADALEKIAAEGDKAVRS
jgi:hypothetical protein